MNAQIQNHAPDSFLADDDAVLRYRRAILRLSESMVCAAGARADLSPLLLEALNHALENLLIYGDVAGLESLEQWLDDGEVVAPPSRAAQKSSLHTAPSENASAVFSERRADFERRLALDRRIGAERRAKLSGESTQQTENHFVERRVKERRTARNRRS